MPARDAKGRITLQDVAKEAGVSLATVSLVLQDKGKLRDETRERVKQAIHRTGYRRKTSAAGHDAESRQYYLIVDDISNPYFHRLYNGIDQHLRNEGALLSLMSSEDSIERQSTLLRNLSHSNVGGLVVVPASGTSAADLHNNVHDQHALILAVRKIGMSDFNYVGANPTLGMMMAIDHLVGLGHRDIAFIGGYTVNYAYGERYAGIAASLMKHGIGLNPDWVIHGGSTRTFGREAASRLLALKRRPTAIIGYNDVVAIGAMDALTAAGIKPGSDIAIMGYDDIPEAAQQPVALTTIATPADKLGEVIANALLSLSADQPAQTVLDITYPPRLVARESCGEPIGLRSMAEEEHGTATA